MGVAIRNVRPSVNSQSPHSLKITRPWLGKGGRGGEEIYVHASSTLQFKIGDFERKSWNLYATLTEVPRFLPSKQNYPYIHAPKY